MEFFEFLKEKNNHTYNYDKNCSKFKIKDIFNDHWYSFLEDNPNLNIRPIVYEEVEKMMGCGSLSNGYAVYISTLHTFGRDLKWNPHVHVLITEGASGNFTPWKKFDYFPFAMLRLRFQTTLLSLLEKHFGKIKFESLKKKYLQYF